MHIILWEFEVREGKVDEFLRAYGSDGDWARLFRQIEGYQGTELLRSTANPNCFVTIDRWTRAEDFRNLRRRFEVEYSALDAEFSKFTLSEIKIGIFESEK